MDETKIKLDAIRKLLELPEPSSTFGEEKCFSTAPKNGKPFLVIYEGAGKKDPYILHWDFYHEDGKKLGPRWCQFPNGYFARDLAEKHCKIWYPLPGVDYEDKLDDGIPF